MGLGRPKAGLRLEGTLTGRRDRERTVWRESKVVGKVVEGRGEAVEEGGPYMEEEGLEPRIVCSVKLVHYSFGLSLCMAGHKSRVADGKAADGWLVVLS